MDYEHAYAQANAAGDDHQYDLIPDYLDVF